jgi:hypothetical protein
LREKALQTESMEQLISILKVLESIANSAKNDEDEVLVNKQWQRIN